MNDKEPKTNDKEWRLEITREQYEAAKAKGLDEETLFKPGTHVFRRRDPNKIIKKENRTVVLHLDAETFDYYERRAEVGQTSSVEEQIKIELRKIVEKEAA